MWPGGKREIYNALERQLGLTIDTPPRLANRREANNQAPFLVEFSEPGKSRERSSPNSTPTGLSGANIGLYC